MRMTVLAALTILAIPTVNFYPALVHDYSDLLIAPAAAQERVQSLHDIPWYVDHPAERDVTIRLCQSDTAIARSPDCANANLAATRAHANHLARGSFNGVDSMLSDPKYWAANRIARAGQLSDCAHGLWNATPSSCAAARAGEAMDGNWVTKNGR